jgi:hypothetical protein
MKIETNDDVIFLKEVYNTIILKTNEGKCLYLCMRDGGFEMSVDNKNWHIIHSDDDFAKPETLEEVDYLQGFINQFEENGELQELSNDDWTVSQFLEWLKLNNYKIIKNETI